MTHRKLEIWTFTDQPDAKAGLPALGRDRLQITEVDAQQVVESLRSVMTEFEKLSAAPAGGERSFEIDSIELNFGVNAKGSVALIGKLEAGMEAGIKVVIKRAARE